MICIIPIDPMNKMNGGLWIDKNNYPIDGGAEEDVFWIDAEPGDIIFLHPLLYHGSGPNFSQFPRRTLLTGFCAFGANHARYPGADVNVRLTLIDNERIEETLAPWYQERDRIKG